MLRTTTVQFIVRSLTSLEKEEGGWAVKDILIHIYMNDPL